MLINIFLKLNPMNYTKEVRYTLKKKNGERFIVTFMIN
jgi:hypothetical protein